MALRVGQRGPWSDAGGVLVDCLLGLALGDGLLACPAVDGPGRTPRGPSLAAINDQLRTGTDKGNLTV